MTGEVSRLMLELVRTPTLDWATPTLDWATLTLDRATPTLGWATSTLGWAGWATPTLVKVR